MTVSMRVMSAGRGYDYLLKSVVRGDRNMGGTTALTRYYTEEGTPPGRWLGSGLHALGNGEIKQGDEVTPQQLALLLGTGRDPVTGEPLGRAFPEYDGVKARVAARVSKLPRDLSDEQRREAAATIAHEEVAAGTRRACAARRAPTPARRGGATAAARRQVDRPKVLAEPVDPSVEIHPLRECLVC